jgi:hypothetical protein
MCFNNEMYINFRKFSDAEHQLGFISLDKKIVSYDYEDQLNISITFVLSQVKKEIY